MGTQREEEGGVRGERGGKGGALVVHVGTSEENPVRWQFMWDALPPYYRRHPVGSSVRMVRVGCVGGKERGRGRERERERVGVRNAAIPDDMAHECRDTCKLNATYAVATISRLLKIIGLFCKRVL